MKSKYLVHDNPPLELEHTKEMNIEFDVQDTRFEENYDFEGHSIKDHDFNHIETEDEHNVLKRSVCKPHQEFQSECNQCKCAADGQSYTCTQNECMDGVKNKEVEVFMETEVSGRYIFFIILELRTWKR